VEFSVIESDIKALNDDIEQQIDSLWSDNSVIQLIEFHDSISSIARDIIRKGLPIGWKLKPMDAIQLASAKWINSKEFYTYDPQLKRYTDIIGCKICEPYIEQPKLPM
jgi:predicted nucleic acid-binding protein